MPVIRPSDRRVDEITYFKDKPPNLYCWLTEAAGLTQFGAFIHVLQPGTRSSITHWHSSEDELVYVLEGEVVLIEGENEVLLSPGDAAAFKAGVPVGHSLWNKSDAPSKCLIVGTRSAVDTCTYPENDRMLHSDRTKGTDVWTNLRGELAGDPYSS